VINRGGTFFVIAGLVPAISIRRAQCRLSGWPGQARTSPTATTLTLGEVVCPRYGASHDPPSYTAADIPAITAIYAHAVKYGTATFEVDPPSEREMADRFCALAEGGFPYFVAERDGEVLGYAYAGPYRPRIAYRYTPSKIRSMLPRTATGRASGAHSWISCFPRPAPEDFAR